MLIIDTIVCKEGLIIDEWQLQLENETRDFCYDAKWTSVLWRDREKKILTTITYLTLLSESFNCFV